MICLKKLKKVIKDIKEDIKELEAKLAERDKTIDEINKEFLSDTNECIITVSYGDCNFQFLTEGEVTE